MKYIDLTHTFVDNMPVYFGDPPTSLKQITTIAKNGYTDHQLTTVIHVGTHMDAPLHMIEGGAYMSDISLDHFTGVGICIDVRGEKVIDADVIPKEIPEGAVVLLCTGMSAKYGKDTYATEYPKISEAFARKLISLNAKILGIDMLNPDTSESYPIHKILLAKPVLIIENLTNLDALIGIKQFDVIAFPMKLHAEGAPVRVVARIP
jgi:kynurenine formamidase